MSPTLEKYLNEMLLTEIESMLEFSLQASLPEGQAVRERLLDFAHEELEHVNMLMGMIVRTGGAVSVGRPDFIQADSLGDFFCRSAAREDDSITRYTALLELVESPEDKALLERAVAQERAHKELLEVLRSSCEAPGLG